MIIAARPASRLRMLRYCHSRPNERHLSVLDLRNQSTPSQLALPLLRLPIVMPALP